ncbi:hypothetical protein BX600DRAFT_473707 [Xylariales sp. PMI_506]|nr:hypothetical protein BX600DRAFT_473707 [Xylariales sp. PMI_506]
MPRGKRTEEEDGAWRPSREDLAEEEEEDELLNEELETVEKAPKAQKHVSSRASASPRQKKTVHRPKRQDDETWRPTGEDIDDDELEDEEMIDDNHLSPSRPSTTASHQAHPKQRKSEVAHPKKTTHRHKVEDDDTWKPTGQEIGDEELEVQEMINDQLLGEDLPERKPRKTSPRPKKHHDDDEWKPSGEGLDEEELEDGSLANTYDKPANAKPTTPRKSKKRVAASPAASPNQHKISTPAPRPTWRLTPASNTKAPPFIQLGQNPKALFSFAAYRGEGMCMLAMNWKNGPPPDDFVGFAIEYQEPQSSEWHTIPNYLTFPGEAAREGSDAYSSRLSPHQRFRWVHFPYSVDTPGQFHYRVIPAFIKGDGDDHTLSYGEVQEVALELAAETYPGKMNVAFTRGFVSSKAFLKKFGADGVGSILPMKAAEGLTFKPQDAQMEEKALSWMGMEAREVILGALDAAINDTTAEVRVLAYDFNEPEIVQRLQKLGKRLKIIIDDSTSHDKDEDAESKAAEMLRKTAGKDNVQRQHMGSLQHNKVIVVDGRQTAIAIGGSTNLSWRGLYVQNNNLVALQGAQPVKIFREAFDNYWNHPNDTDGFYKTASSQWMDLGLGIDAQVTFSPHSSSQGTLDSIAADIKACKSSLFYSLAFLYETPGVIRDAIEKKMGQKGVMVYGISDKSVGGLDARKNGNPPVAYPEDFEAESAGGSGARMHHKFVVIDFNTPDARVYTGSHNFSNAADTKNAENLFLIRDQRVATAYMIEAVAMFDHYEVRDHVAKKKEAEKKGEKHTIHLRLPPTKKGEKPWWDQYWTVKQMINDREMFGV